MFSRNGRFFALKKTFDKKQSFSKTIVSKHHGIYCSISETKNPGTVPILRFWPLAVGPSKCRICQMLDLSNVASVKGRICPMSYLSNVTSLKCRIYRMSYLSNVSSGKCLISKIFLYMTLCFAAWKNMILFTRKSDRFSKV